MDFELGNAKYYGVEPDRYTVLPISDGQRTFPFLYDGLMVYVPDYNPEAYGQTCGYRITVSYWRTVGFKSTQTPLVSYDFDAREFEAIPPFRYNGHTYRQAFSLITRFNKEYMQPDVNMPRISQSIWAQMEFFRSHKNDQIYVELLPLIYGTSEVNANYDGAQGTTKLSFGFLFTDRSYSPRSIGDTNPLPIGMGNDVGDLDIIIRHRDADNNFQMLVAPNKFNLIDYIKRCYGGVIEPEVQVSCEMALVGENDMYWIQKDRPYTNGKFIFNLNKSTDWFFNWQHQYIKDLEFVAIMHIVVMADEHEMHVDIKSNPYPLTEQVYAEILKQNENTIDISEMVVQKPRIINKTVQKTVIMNSQTDSKSNIIQPVFFRSRDLAQIIVHPEVTENICINLDAYKSQVERFYIKIEGIAFEEIGRVESGIIFKVKGNLLPGELGVGTYYVLNENADLVTTGKYIYDR